MKDENEHLHMHEVELRPAPDLEPGTRGFVVIVDDEEIGEVTEHDGDVHLLVDIDSRGIGTIALTLPRSYWLGLTHALRMLLRMDDTLLGEAHVRDVPGG